MTDTSPPLPLMTAVIQFFVLAILCLTAPLPSLLRRLLQRLPRSLYNQCSTPFRYPIHGRWLWFNARSSYPITVASYPLMNAALVDGVAACFHSLGRPATMIDVGAAIGDTLSLIEERCPHMIGRHFCIEAAPHFLELLRRNTAAMPQVTIIPQLLAAEEKTIPSLVHTHGSTAAAVGEDQVQAIPLDRVPELQNQRIDLLKIDVDGYDGEVLAGARQLIARDQPLIIFEWHPVLWQRAGNDLFQVFTLLRDAGYDRLLWFHNTGEFSHFTSTTADALVQHRHTAHYLQKESPQGDPHFDIIALHQGSKIDPVDLARLPHTRQWLKR